MKFLSSWSIRKKLLFLIFVAVLPALGIILFSGIERRENEIASTKRDILYLVKSLAAQQEQLAASTRQMLKMLAQMPEVQKIDANACNRLFRDIQEQNPAYAVINAVTPDGNMFAVSEPFTPGSVNLADRKHIRDAIRTRDFSVGEYIAGRVVKVPTILYTYPVLDKNGKLIAIVSAGIKLDKYKEFMAQLNLPEGSVTSIADHKNITLYRLPESEDIPPGTPMPVTLLQGIPIDSREGISEGIGRDNVNRIFAYKKLWLRDNEPPYLSIYVGVDKNVALHQANMELVYNLGILGIACLFAMLLAWIAGNSLIVGPLHKLAIATKRFGEGEMHVRTDLPHQEDELGRLAKSFDTMAVMLEMKDLERRKAEEKLRESEEKYRNIFNAAILGIYQTTPEGRILSANPALIKMFGYDTLEELFNNVTSTQTYVNSEDREIFKRILSKEGKVEKYEAPFRKKGGELIWVSINGHVVKDGQGNISSFEGTIEDITERKNAEEEKHRMEERSRKVVEDIFRFIPEGVLVFSRKMELLRQNQAFRELVSGYAGRLGFAEDELENLIIDKVKAGLRDNNIKEIKIARKHETGKQT